MFSKKGFVALCLVILTALLINGCFTTPTTVTGVTLNHAAMTLPAGGATGTLVATVAPATATNKSVNWSSSAPVVATVSNGVITPLTAGTTTITVTTVDGSKTATCAVTVTATAAVVVTLSAIPGVTVPVTGAVPVTTITATAQYTGTVTWSPTAATFAAGTVYTATITLTAKTGYTFTGVTANFFTVAGASDTNPANSGVVTAVFPATAAVVVTLSAIPGVTVPVIGAVPVTTITATAQYTGTVTWLPADTTFVAGTVYTATITLTAKTGYTFTGVTANFFTVAGAVSNANLANSGVVTAVFPATAAVVVTLSAIPGVTAPVTGAVPVTTITATAQYTGTVTWSPTAATFAAGTVYTATITLTAKAGYTFTGVAANFFTVAGASDTNPANSGVVTAVFPTTAAVVVTLSAIPGVTAPVTGAVPVITITATAQYTGTVTWLPADTTFAAGTIYTATITLTAKTGYTFTGVAANFFTVAGASDTNPANSGVVTAVFPTTAAPVIATVSTIANADTNPTVTVTGTGFKAGLAAGDLTVTVGTTGLVLGTVTRVSATQLTVAFTGTAAAGDVTIQAKTSAFDPTAGAVSNILTVTVAAVAVTAVSDGIATATGTTTITLGQIIPGLTAGDIVVKIGGVELDNSGDTKYTLGGLATTGVTITFLTGAALNSASIVTVVMTKAGYIINAGNPIAVVNTIPPVIATVSTIANADTNPTVTVTGTGFKAGLAAGDLTVTVGTTGLVLGTVTRVSATQLTVAFTGTAAAGDVTIQAKTSAFDPTAGAESNVLTVTVPVTISLAAIPGVTIPVTGETPVTLITPTAQYTGTVIWWPEHATFAASKVYTATITLTPEAGYTFTGVTANFFTVDGAEALNAADSGVVTAPFPATLAPVIATVSTIAPEDTNPTVTVTGTDFKAGIVMEDLTVDVTATEELIFSDLTGVSATEITVAFTGTADSGDVVTIQAKISAFDPTAGAVSNVLTINVP